MAGGQRAGGRAACGRPLGQRPAASGRPATPSQGAPSSHEAMAEQNQIYFEVEVNNTDVVYLENLTGQVARKKVSLQLFGAHTIRMRTEDRSTVSQAIHCLPPSVHNR